MKIVTIFMKQVGEAKRDRVYRAKALLDILEESEKLVPTPQ
jgi:hypothetical protein